MVRDYIMDYDNYHGDAGFLDALARSDGTFTAWEWIDGNARPLNVDEIMREY